MIRISFMNIQRKIIEFTIEDKVVTYFDEIWKDGIQVMPQNQEVVNSLTKSRKPNLMLMAAFILDTNKEENLEEYNACKTDRELADIIIADALTKGLREIK